MVGPPALVVKRSHSERRSVPKADLTLFESFIWTSGSLPSTFARNTAPPPPSAIRAGCTRHYAELREQRIHLQPERWDVAFRTQTGQNINVSVNGIAKLLQIVSEDHGRIDSYPLPSGLVPTARGSVSVNTFSADCSRSGMWRMHAAKCGAWCRGGRTTTTLCHREVCDGAPAARLRGMCPIFLARSPHPVARRIAADKPSGGPCPFGWRGRKETSCGYR